MAKPDDVEFLPPSSEPGPDEDAPSTARRRRARWPIAVLVACVAAGVTGFELTHDDSGRPSAATSGTAVSTQSAPPRSSSRTPPAPTSGLDRPLPLGSDAPVLTIAAARSSVWVWQPRLLTRLDLGAGSQHVRVPALHIGQGGGARMLLDRDAFRLWIFVQGVGGGRIFEYDSISLKLIRTVPTPFINGAAVLGERLYLTSSSGLFELAPHTRLRQVAHLPARFSLGTIVIDPGAPHRILLAGYGLPTQLWVYDTVGRRIRRIATLPVQASNIVEVDGVIWVSGTTRGRAAILRRLDPRTLHLIVGSSPARLGQDARIVSAGQSVFWMRSDFGAGTTLYCVSPIGQIEQRWRIDGKVTSSYHNAVVASAASGVVPLQLAGCPG